MPTSQGSSISQTLDRGPARDVFFLRHGTNPRVDQQTAAIRDLLERIDTLPGSDQRLEKVGEKFHALAERIKDSIEQREKQERATAASPPTLVQGPPPDPPHK